MLKEVFGVLRTRAGGRQDPLFVEILHKTDRAYEVIRIDSRGSAAVVGEEVGVIRVNRAFHIVTGTYVFCFRAGFELGFKFFAEVDKVAESHRVFRVGDAAEIDLVFLCGGCVIRVSRFCE